VIEKAFLVAGLIITLVGAALAAWNVMIKDATASQLAATMWNSNEALKKALLAQSRGAAWGLALVGVGTLFQIISVLVSPSS
jgi:hypothetical protein